MAADMESGKTDIGFVVNKTIELRTSSFYVLAADLLKSCPKGAEIFTSWLGSVITDEAEKIDRGTGLGIIMNLIGNFYQLEDGNLFECLMDQIDSEDWFRKLTEEQKSALAKSIIDNDTKVDQLELDLSAGLELGVVLAGPQRGQRGVDLALEVVEGEIERVHQLVALLGDDDARPFRLDVDLGDRIGRRKLLMIDYGLPNELFNQLLKLASPRLISMSITLC